MIHEQEKLELLTQQVDIAQSAMENKLFSREWVYDNIFDLNQEDKKVVFDGVIEDQKQIFRMEQISTEGNDPAETGAAAEDMEEDVGEWGGSEKGPRLPDTDRGRSSSEDIKDATKYEKERWGKREFKGGSPLYPGKGATAVKSEGLLDSLKQKFGKNGLDAGILNENSLLDDENG